MEEKITREAELPQEIITSEILTRLPIKSLIRFQLVSKFWKTLISSLQFSKLHLLIQQSSSNSTQKLLINDDDTSFSTFDYTHYDKGQTLAPPCESHNLKDGGGGGGCGLLVDVDLTLDISTFIDLADDRFGVTIIGSSDGLIGLDFGTNCLVIWNPAIRESRKISNPPSFRKKELIFGFGYVSNIDDYKIVSVSQKLNSCRKKAHVFSLKGVEWKKIDMIEGYNVDSLTRPGVLVDEKVFWRMLNRFGVLCILGFDLENECFIEVEIPDWIETLVDFFLCVIGGCLCGCWKDSEGSVEIAMLKEFGNWGSWVKLYTIDCDRFYCCNLFGYTKSEKLIMDTLEGSVLLLDNLDHEYPTYVEILRLSTKKNVVCYVETLVSPYGFVEPKEMITQP